jgi:hypothetical protein
MKTHVLGALEALLISVCILHQNGLEFVHQLNIIMPCIFLARVYANEHLVLLTFFYNIPPLDNKNK